MHPMIRAVISWAIALWACKVFLSSIPYKFTNHPDTEHIFGTIGNWLKNFLGEGVGNLFVKFGAYAIGSFELLTSVVLLAPALVWVFKRLSSASTAGIRPKIHAAGGLMAAAVMAGAVFFHLVSPLGVEVLHEGESDGGSLFYSALSILIGGIVLFLINFGAAKSNSGNIVRRDEELARS